MKAGRNGFSLLEVLVASALMVLMAGVVVALSASVLRHWNRATAESGQLSQTRAALDLLSADLAGALAEVRRGEGSIVVEILDQRAGRERFALHFFSNAAGPGTPAGSLRKVSWWASADTAASPFIDDQIPSLFRGVSEPEETWLDWSGNMGPLSAQIPSGAVETPVNGLILPGCVSFSIEVWERTADGRPIAVYADESFSQVGDRLILPRPGAAGERVVAEVSLRVVVRVLPRTAVEELRYLTTAGAVPGFDQEAWIAEHALIVARRLRVGAPGF